METTNQRPVLVTIICILSFIGIAFSVFGLIMALVASSSLAAAGVNMPIWYSIFSLVWAVGYLYATIQIWKMKKMGVNIYTGLAVIDYVLMTVAYGLSMPSLVITVVCLVLLYTQYKKMS
ncbi:MAG: hypothetical protein WCF94_01590 [bacterium]